MSWWKKSYKSYKRREESGIPGWIAYILIVAEWLEGFLGKISNNLMFMRLAAFDRHCNCSACKMKREKGEQNPRKEWYQW